MCVTRYNTNNTMAKTGVINARVEQSVRDRLETYCHENKVKMAVIIEEALSQWLDANANAIAHNTFNTDAHKSYEGAIAELEKKIKELVGQMEGKIDQQQLDERLAMATSPIWEHLEEKIDQQQLDERLAMATSPIWAELDNTPSKPPLKQTETTYEDDSPSTASATASASPPSFADGLNQRELAKRLHTNPQSLNNWNKAGKLEEKSKERDPDGMAWERRGNIYFPVGG